MLSRSAGNAPITLARLFGKGAAKGAATDAATDAREELGAVGGVRIERLSRARRTAIESYEAMPAGHKMLALLELDVTEAQRAIERQRAEGVRVSLFSFVVASIAHALAEFPVLNTIRHKNDVFYFDDVDVYVPVELHTRDGLAPRRVVVRRAHTMNAREVFAEIGGARDRFATAGVTGGEERWVHRLTKVARFFPRFVRVWFLRRLTNSPRMAKRFVGTTSVTSVGKFASIPGFVVPYMNAPLTTLFALGSVVEKPAVVDGAIVARSFLSVSITLDHDVVDGAPAARFVARLQDVVEHARGL